MALQRCKLNIDDKQRELSPHGTIEFPLAGFHSFHTIKTEDNIPWHFHEEVELIYIEEGCLEITFPNHVYLLHKGDYIFINTHILHQLKGHPYGALKSFVFHPRLIYGTKDTIYYSKYVFPILTHPTFIYHVYETNLDEFNNAFEALKADILGYEFIVRSCLSKCWLILYQELFPLNQPSLSHSIHHQRYQAMIHFIHAHYFEDLTLEDIAHSAFISKRECLRCFKSIAQVSPIQYLIRYRVLQAAQLLINSDQSVSQIAIHCGFNHPSHFSKVFKHIFECSPLHYKNNGKKY